MSLSAGDSAANSGRKPAVLGQPYKGGVSGSRTEGKGATGASNTVMIHTRHSIGTGSPDPAAHALGKALSTLTVLPEWAENDFKDDRTATGPRGLTDREFNATIKILGVLGVDANELASLGKEVESRARWRQFSMLLLGYVSSFFAGGVASIEATKRGCTPEESFAIGMTVLGCGRQFMASTMRLAALDPPYYVQRREPKGFNTMNFVADLAASVGFFVWHMVVDTGKHDPSAASQFRLGSGAAAAVCGGVMTAYLLTRESKSWGPVLHVWLNGSDRALPDAAYSRHHVASDKDKAILESKAVDKPVYARNAHAARMSHAVASLRKSKCEAFGGAILDLGNGMWRALGIPGRYAITGAVATGLLATSASAPRLKGVHELADGLLGNWGFIWRAKEYFNNSSWGGGPYRRIPEAEFDKVFRKGAPNNDDDACENGAASGAGGAGIRTGSFSSVVPAFEGPGTTEGTPTTHSSSSASTEFSHDPSKSREGKHAT